MTFARQLFLCLSLICFGCNTVPPEHLQTFQNAQSAFDSGDYRQSAALYEKLLDQGVRSGAIYYNLGNAWAKADEPVRAVTAYYLAKRHIPGDPHLNANLRAVLKSNGGTPPPPESSLAGSLLFWQDWIGYNTKIWVALALAALTFLGGVLCLFLGSTHGSRRLCRRPGRITLGLAILAVIAFVSVGYDWYRFEGVKRIIVITDTLPRKGNSEQYEPAFVSPIPFGTLAVVLDERSGWYSLRFPSGQDGWIPQSQTFRLQ